MIFITLKSSNHPQSVQISKTTPIFAKNSNFKLSFFTVWQIVNGTRFKFFVFSAYYDRRDGRMIRIIGATKTRSPEKVFCRMWYPINNSTKYRSISIMARVKVIRENWNLKYSAVFILCPLRISALEVPYSVSIVSKLRMSPGNNLLIRNTDNDPDFTNRTVENIPKDKIAVCVKPLHFNYNQVRFSLI